MTIVGVVLGLIAETPLVVGGPVVIAELAAVSLTVHKSLRDPRSETRSTWFIDCLAGVVAIAAVPDLSLAALLYPVHHTLANAAVLVAIAVGRRRASQAQRDEVPQLSPCLLYTSPSPRDRS